MKNPTYSTTAPASAIADRPNEVVDETPRFSRRDTLLTMLGVLWYAAGLARPNDRRHRHAAHYFGVARLRPLYLGHDRLLVDFYGDGPYLWQALRYLRPQAHLPGRSCPLPGGLRRVGCLPDDKSVDCLSCLPGAWVPLPCMPIAMAVIGDLFTPRERGRWQGVTGAVFGLSSILGPAAGGWITDNSTWRWVFYVNLPVGLIAMLVLIFLMPTLRSANPGKPSIDYLGAALLIGGTVPLLLGFTWAGSQYAWLSCADWRAVWRRHRDSGAVYHSTKRAWNGGMPNRLLIPACFAMAFSTSRC